MVHMYRQCQFVLMDTTGLQRKHEQKERAKDYSLQTKR